MKLFTTATAALAALAATALAAPVAEPVAVAEPATEIERRQSVGTTANEFTRFGCRDVLFFFARGSTEVGNMVGFLNTLQPRILTSLGSCCRPRCR
jgi:opacity protein-like surface antigen